MKMKNLWSAALISMMAISLGMTAEATAAPKRKKKSQAAGTVSKKSTKSGAKKKAGTPLKEEAKSDASGGAVPNHLGGRPLGLGVQFGEPTGFTAKWWQDSETAFDAGLAYSFSSFFQIYADHLWHFPQALESTSLGGTRLVPYAGAGLELFINTDSRRTDKKFYTEGGGTAGLGIRIPLGVEWMPASKPIGLYAELVPGFGFVPKTFFFFQGGIGGRYYF